MTRMNKKERAFVEALVEVDKHDGQSLPDNYRSTLARVFEAVESWVHDHPGAEVLASDRPAFGLIGFYCSRVKNGQIEYLRVHTEISALRQCSYPQMKTVVDRMYVARQLEQGQILSTAVIEQSLFENLTHA